MKWLIILLLASILVTLPFFHPGYFPTHDGLWAVVRLSDMVNSLRDLQFPVRYSGFLNHGYGYPLFNFTYPMPYYFGAFLHLFHFGLIDSVKIIFALSVPLSALFMFAASKEFWKSNLAGFISAMLYIFLPYRIVDLYARGSIGESISLFLFPLIFWSILKISSPRKYLFVIVSAIGFSLLITSHNIMTVLYLPVISVLVVGMSAQYRKKVLLPLGLFVFLGLGLAAFFWIPALAEKHYILLSKIPIADRNLYFVSLPQLLMPKWGYGLPDDLKNGFTYQIGLSQLMVFLLSGLVLFRKLFKKNKFSENNIFLAGVLWLLTLILILLMFPPAKIVWEKLPLLSEINYPWTLLAPIGFLMCLLAGLLGKNSKLQIIGLALILLALGLVVPNAKPSKFINVTDNYFASNDATTTSSNELMPLWVKNFPKNRPDNKAQIISGSGKISGLVYNSRTFHFLVNSQSNSLVQINTIYYPGWQLIVDSNITPISYDNDSGLIHFPLNSGDHFVVGRFQETTLRFWSDTISVISLMGLIVIIFISLKKSKKSLA